MLALSADHRIGVVTGCAVMVVGYAIAIHASRAASRPSWPVIFVVAVLARGILIGAPPVLEDDVHRYLWDGAVLSSGESPYHFSPQQIMDARLDRELELSPAERVRLDALVALSRAPDLEPSYLAINYPSVPTIYPPAAQAVFGGLASITPGSIFAMKLALVIADLLAAVAVYLLLCRLGRPRWWLVVYLWSPLVILEFAGAAHLDSLAMAALVWALLMLHRNALVAAGVLLGIAVAFKLFAALVIPLVLRRLGVRGVLAIGFTIALAFLPFATEPRLFEGLRTFAARWRDNEGGFALVAAVLGDQTARPAIGLALVALVGVLAWRTRREPLAIDAVTWALVALVVMSPAVNPWYVAWLIPLGAIVGSWPISVLGVTSLAYYARALFVDDLAVRGLEYGVPLIVALALRWRAARERQLGDFSKDGRPPGGHGRL